MDVLLPLLGDVMTEGTVTSWFQSDGAYVRAGEPLYQVETDKVNLTVDAPESGTLQQLVQEGETVPVGAVVARLVATAAEAPALATHASAKSESPGPRPSGLAVGTDAAARSEGSERRTFVSTGSVAEKPTGESSDVSATTSVAVTEVRATPAARALARKLGVDLRRIANGRRLREADVLAVRAQRDTAGGSPLAGRRKVIAERMRASLAQTAQLTVSMEVDMTAALELHEQLRQVVAEDRRPTITDLVLRAAVLALREHPHLNATFEKNRLEVHSEVHVGIAVDADDGLIVPVVRDAHLLDLVTLAGRSRALSSRARNNTLKPDELQGGTFTVTSLGPLGVDFFTPILNPPQVAILGIGRVFTKLALQSGKLAERQMLYLNLSFDHQAVDGAPAARFLQTIKHYLELPAALVVQSSL
jgi:pyruvate dehydrogenase E2 component (dihydrolipoamide acetyltransferase)